MAETAQRRTSGWFMSDELKGVMTCFEQIYRRLPGRTEENLEKPIRPPDWGKQCDPEEESSMSPPIVPILGQMNPIHNVLIIMHDAGLRTKHHCADEGQQPPFSAFCLSVFRLQKFKPDEVITSNQILIPKVPIFDRVQNKGYRNNEVSVIKRISSFCTYINIT
jgi:hypothetical protein